jgi:hypothetical protein
VNFSHKQGCGACHRPSSLANACLLLSPPVFSHHRPSSLATAARLLLPSRSSSLATALIFSCHRAHLLLPPRSSSLVIARNSPGAMLSTTHRRHYPSDLLISRAK